jgi:hypothetical protein
VRFIIILSTWLYIIYHSRFLGFSTYASNPALRLSHVIYHSRFLGFSYASNPALRLSHVIYHSRFLGFSTYASNPALRLSMVRKVGESPPCIQKIFFPTIAAAGMQLKTSVKDFQRRISYRFRVSSKKPYLKI